MNIGTLTLFIIITSSLLTSIISGVIGMAGGVTLLSIMTFILPFSLIVPIHGAAQLSSNLSRSFLLRKSVNKKIFFWFILGAPIGTIISVQIIKSVENREVFLLFIALLILYTLFKPKKLPNFIIPHKGFLLLGALTGFLGPLIGATGPLMAVFFLREELSKEEIVATKAASQAFIHLLKIPAFLYLAFPYSQYIWVIALLILSSIIGTKIGVLLLGRINEALFKKLYETALLISALRIFYKILF